MKSVLSALLVAATTAAAVPAFAGTPAENQQAQQLGLPQDTYSMAQMQRIEQAKLDNDTNTIRYILANPAFGQVTRDAGALNSMAVRIDLNS